MLVLLPPSESKTPPANGDPVDLSALSHPELADARTRVAAALIKVSGQRNAMQVLGAGASLASEVAANASLWHSPAAPAARVYAGVLYDAAGMAAWDHATLEHAQQRVRIISALWGALALADPIPAYRLSMATSLGRIGPLAQFWRPRLAAPLEALAGDGLVVDCRSSSYAAAWRPAGAQWVTVKVVRDVDGTRAVVSHMAKHTRGLLAAHLVSAAAAPTTAADLADAAASMIGTSLLDITLRPSQGSDRSELTLVIAG